MPSRSNTSLADCATYITSRIEKIRAGIVPDNRSAEAVEELWETGIVPHLRTRDVWFP